jgi:hypothetical protein
MAGPTTHHCPKKSKGGCRKGYKTRLLNKSYCPEHQTYCPNPGCKERVHLKTEACVQCVARQQADDKKKKEDERKRKAKEDAERKAAQQAQSMRDKTPKNKQQKY